MAFALAGSLVGLAGIAATITVLAMCVVLLVRGLTLPSERRHGPTCGACGYEIDIANSNGFCPECGSDLARVGVVSPGLLLRLRGGPWLVHGAWFCLAVFAGVLFTYVTVMALAMGAIVGGGGFGGSAVEETSTFTPVLQDQPAGPDATPAYSLRVSTAFETFYAPNPAVPAAAVDFSSSTGSVTLIAEGDPDCTLTVDASTGTWRIDAGDNTVASAQASPGSLGIEVFERFLREAGMTDEDAIALHAVALDDGLAQGLRDAWDFENLFVAPETTASRFEPRDVFWDSADTATGTVYTSSQILVFRDRSPGAPLSLQLSAKLSDSEFLDAEQKTGSATFAISTPASFPDVLATLTLDAESASWFIEPAAGVEDPSLAGDELTAAAFTALFETAGLGLDESLRADAEFLAVAATSALAAGAWGFHEELAYPVLDVPDGWDPATNVRFSATPPVSPAMGPMGFRDTWSEFVAALAMVLLWVIITAAGFVFIAWRRRRLSRIVAPA